MGDIEVTALIIKTTNFTTGRGVCICSFVFQYLQDSHGRLCIVCPWHKHCITLDTGESLYSSIDPKNPRNVKHNCSKGAKQVGQTLLNELTNYAPSLSASFIVKNGLTGGQTSCPSVVSISRDAHSHRECIT